MPQVRGFFNWKYSAAIIFFFYALAVAMIGIGLAVEPFEELFEFAYLFFACSVLWAVGWWLTSEPLAARKPKLTRRQKRRLETVSYVSYRTWKWGVSFLMVLVFLGSLKLTRKIEVARELSLSHGWLVPGNDPTPDSACSGEKDLLLVFLGPLAAGANKFPNTVFTAGGTPRMTINKNGRGEVAVTTDIYDENENIIVSIRDNAFTVANDVFQVQRPDKSTLIVVIRRRKERVLDVRFLNKTAIRIWGHFRYPGARELVVTGEEIRVGDQFRMRGSGNCAVNAGRADFAF